MSGRGKSGLSARNFEQLTVIIDPDFRTSYAQRIPQRNLVRSEYRSAEVFFQRGDHADGAKSVPADEHGVRRGWHMAANPLVNLGWTRRRACVRMGNLNRRRQMARVHDLESTFLKVCNSFLVEVVSEEGRMDERDSFCFQCPKAGSCGRCRHEDRNAI